MCLPVSILWVYQYYEGLVRSLEQEEVKLNTNTVKAKLLLEEKRLKRDDEGPEENRVLTTKKTPFWIGSLYKKDTQQNIANRHEHQAKVIYCFCCGAKGHIARY